LIENSVKNLIFSDDRAERAQILGPARPASQNSRPGPARARQRAEILGPARGPGFGPGFATSDIHLNCTRAKKIIDLF
jgi:hypothetical protein